MCFSEKNGLKKSVFPSKIAALVQPVSENGQWIFPKIISKEFFWFVSLYVNKIVQNLQNEIPTLTLPT